MNRNKTPNNNITTIAHYICFPHKEPGCGVAFSHRVGPVQLLLTIFNLFHIPLPIFVTGRVNTNLTNQSPICSCWIFAKWILYECRLL